MHVLVKINGLLMFLMFQNYGYMSSSILEDEVIKKARCASCTTPESIQQCDIRLLVFTLLLSRKFTVELAIIILTPN